MFGQSESDPEGLNTYEIRLWHRIKDTYIRGRRTGLGITAEGDMQEKKAKCKLAAVALYIKQRERDLQREGKSEVIYGNSNELRQLETYFSNNFATTEEKNLLSEIQECYGKKFEPKQTGIMDLEGLVKSDEEALESYSSELTETKSRDTVEKEIQ